MGTSVSTAPGCGQLRSCAGRRPSRHVMHALQSRCRHGNRWSSQRTSLEDAMIFVRAPLHAAPGRETQVLPVSPGCRREGTVVHSCTVVPAAGPPGDGRSVPVAHAAPPTRVAAERQGSGGFVLEDPTGSPARQSLRNSEGGVSARVLPHATFPVFIGLEHRPGRLLQMTPRPAAWPGQARVSPFDRRRVQAR